MERSELPTDNVLSEKEDQPENSLLAESSHYYKLWRILQINMFSKVLYVFRIWVAYTVKPVYSGHLGKLTKWPLTTLNRWPLYRFKIYRKTHRESTQVTVMSRWPLYKGDSYGKIDCICFLQNHENVPMKQKTFGKR